ncbi:hypothetical protein EUGRSUZ_J00292 [Eucalyptus grandis]|uniref:Uncharacterized protein n=2 Tax=Eucalyptus grandis TaxID=71139 RepID=A0ACC3J2A1_EUCGR|nr:hypothetical protein EUGRSUZ_J00292 [Eucalyptus grandis]
MINMVRMLSRKEWVEEAEAMIRLTFSNLSLVEVLSVVVEAAEAEGREEARMSSILSRCLSKISIMVHPRSWHYLATSFVPSAKVKGPSLVLQSNVWVVRVLEVIVEKGMQNGQKIKFPGEADEAPDTVTGDIVFVLQQKEHPKYKRKGDDLFYEHTLSLTESLCGFQFALSHLDGRQLLIKSQPGEVIKPDQFKAINDEGMPIYPRPFMKGKLYIHFTVEFPDTLSPEQCKALETILPPRSSAQLTDMELDECEETTLHDVNIEEEMRRKQAQAQEAYEEDEDMHGGAQRVQCAQQ